MGRSFNVLITMRLWWTLETQTGGQWDINSILDKTKHMKFLSFHRKFISFRENFFTYDIQSTSVWLTNNNIRLPEPKTHYFSLQEVILNVVTPPSFTNTSESQMDRRSGEITSLFCHVKGQQCLPRRNMFWLHQKAKLFWSLRKNQ